MLSEFPHVTLKEVCEINPETVNPAVLYPDSNFNYIDISCVENETGKFLGPNKTSTGEAPSRARRSVKESDILLSTVRPNLKAFTLLTEVPKRAIASTGFAVLRAKCDRILPGFLINVMRDHRSVDQMIGMAGKGAYPSINQTDVESLQIPLPPLEIQKEIVAEIEGYQKVINGARAVLYNYRPQIPINPDWPMVDIRSVSTRITKGTTPTTSGHTYQADGITFLKVESISEDGLLLPEKFAFISKACHQEQLRSQLKQGDVLFSIAGALGRVALVSADILPANTNQALSIITPDQACVLSHYLAHALRTPPILAQAERQKTGVAQYNLSLQQVGDITIHLPPLSTQQAIVAEIEAEQALVAANRELITRFEKKIQSTLARIWGEETPTVADV